MTFPCRMSPSQLRRLNCPSASFPYVKLAVRPAQDLSPTSRAMVAQHGRACPQGCWCAAPRLSGTSRSSWRSGPTGGAPRWGGPRPGCCNGRSAFDNHRSWAWSGRTPGRSARTWGQHKRWWGWIRWAEAKTSVGQCALGRAAQQAQGVIISPVCDSVHCTISDVSFLQSLSIN